MKLKFLEDVKENIRTILSSTDNVEKTLEEDSEPLVLKTLNENRVLRTVSPGYTTFEINPSKMTSNMNVKWLFSDLSRLYTTFNDRIQLNNGKIEYKIENTIWWEVVITRESIKFFLSVPSEENIVSSVSKQILQTWKKSNVKEVPSPLPLMRPDHTMISHLTLQYHPVLSVNTSAPNFSLVSSLLSTKNYLLEDDTAILQIGMTPLGEDWNETSSLVMQGIKENGTVPRKKNKPISKKEITNRVGQASIIVIEELMNLLADFVIPGWEDNRDMSKLMKGNNGSRESRESLLKSKSEGFKTTIRTVAISSNYMRRKSIIRSMCSSFDPLSNGGDNELVEEQVADNKLGEFIGKTLGREHKSRKCVDVLCSLELAKIIQVPDQKAQVEFSNELKVVQHRGESAVPKSVFESDPKAIPFMRYEQSDGSYTPVYFSGKNMNLMCMPRVVIGEPGSGKTTWSVRFAYDAFLKGYGSIAIDGADGDMVNRILNLVPKNMLHKVKVIDFTNSDNPIGLGLNEAFHCNNRDLIEDLIVDEVLIYIELVSGTELNMRSKQWVENAIKVVYTSPDATLIDVERMLNDPDFRASKIPFIEDPQLRGDWEYFSLSMSPKDRASIYEEAFRRLSPVMRKKALKNFVLQKPKKDENGDYLFDIRKWMDEGYLVLVKATEILGETIQTALVSYLMAKINLAIISREDIPVDKRKPCFLILDEPDHYIKGSERWRNMLTRYRKYRCGLTFLFHGWQQLVEADKNLPKIIRKSGPHYIIFKTDEDNLLELQSVIEPEFKIRELAKGMPKQHAVMKLNMYGDNGESTPAFMAKALPQAEEDYQVYDNFSHYAKCAKELGRPKSEVMQEIFEQSSKVTVEYPADTGCDSFVVTEIPKKKDKEEWTDLDKKKLQYEVGNFIEDQLAKGIEPDPEIIELMDEMIEGDDGDILEEG